MCSQLTVPHHMQVMKAWLESIVASLQGEGAESPGKLVSAVCVAYCFLQSIPSAQPKIDKFAIPLLKMLRIQPDLANQACPSYEYLCEVLPIESRYMSSVLLYTVCM